MKQLLQNLKTGELKLDNVPLPILKPGGMLVRNYFSLISAGTERTMIDLAQKSLVGKAKQRPDLVKQVIEKAKRDGIINTFQQVMSRLDAPTPLGYSCAGVVEAVSKDIDEFKVGDRVACAGAGYANHAEIVFVPKNLCVKIPENVDFESAAFVTIGAIALQGVRRAELTLGERVAVIGLGLVGQITAQLVKANGCKVLGIDLDAEKVSIAQELGADCSVVREGNVHEVCEAFSNGIGVDVVIITAATTSNDPIELAAEIARDRGRIVVVGAVKMDVPRKPFYDKELDLRLSRSYGPGRYDADYEEKGIDYPIGYVRWTEKRNMEEFLSLVAQGKVNLRPIITHVFDFADALKAYDLIMGKTEEKYLGVLLKYGKDAKLESKIFLDRDGRMEGKDGREECRERKERKEGKENRRRGRLLEQYAADLLGRKDGKERYGEKKDGRKGWKGGGTRSEIQIGLIGAGNFAKSVLLPNLRKIPSVNIRAIASATGVTAKHVGEKFGCEYVTSSYEDLLADENIHAVVVATRHNLHSKIAVEALKAGKAVFVEKPLAITYQQLEEVIATLQTTDGRIMVGFNRRFSPFTIEIKKLLSNRQAPFCINYRVNAGIIPKDNWIHDPVEGGGRIIGEVCHFVDFLHYIIAAQPIKVYAEGVSEDNDNVFITISFKDGSVGTIGYHLIVLQDYLECLILLKNNSQNYPSLFDDKIKQMLNFLIEILHPDGNIPLFNDSAFGVARSPQDLFAIGAALFKDSRFKATANRFSLFPYLLLGAEGKAAFDEIIASQDSQRQNIALDGSGYYVMRDESNDKFMIIDCGEIGAEYLTGHSHCDTLSYELSIRQERIIVDSGVYAYESREWRDYCRSTRAHNTVAIDNREQSEIWSAFRVARRAKPIEVKWVETENIIFFEGSHNGYTRLGQKLFHKRRIFFVEKRFWIIFDDIRGSGRHTAESYIHIVPDVQFQVNDREKNYQTHVTKNGINALIKFFGADGVRIIEGQMNPIQGWYLPEFGKRFRNKTIILDKAGELPLQFGYLILPYVTTVVDFECEYNLLGEVRLRIRLDDSLYVVECRVDELKFQKQ